MECLVWSDLAISATRSALFLKWFYRYVLGLPH